MNSVLNLILTHQPAATVAKMLQYWSDFVPSESILIAYGGPPFEFDKLQHQHKVFIDDETLRTKDHQREFQSYGGIFRAAAKFVESRPDLSYVHFVEFDHIPLVGDLNRRQIERLQSEQADVLGFHVQRIDGTSHPHFLYHIANDQFAAYWRTMTRRSDPDVVLSMFGTGTFWTRKAFCEVASIREPFPMYLEIYLPTLAHHLGFRLRGLTEQDQFVRA
ncbi:MAG TPA: hypothetical protein VJ719_13965, partial [Chthoniobacterales bacterium]|nr:hypothetical protein [Chthoniobacterales bacterium]